MIMKKILLILCLFSMSAHAEWQYFGNTDIATFYIDYSRIKTEGRYKSMWHLVDLKSPQTALTGKQYKSYILKNLVDCQGPRFQKVAVYNYSEQMSKGEVVWSHNFQIVESDWGWEYPPPNSIYDDLMNTTCSRK